jgi:hypothetical protein
LGIAILKLRITIKYNILHNIMLWFVTMRVTYHESKSITTLIMLSAVMLSVVMMSVVMLSVVILSVIYAECRGTLGGS